MVTEELNNFGFRLILIIIFFMILIMFIGVGYLNWVINEHVEDIKDILLKNPDSFPNQGEKLKNE